MQEEGLLSIRVHKDRWPPARPLEKKGFSCLLTKLFAERSAALPVFSINSLQDSIRK